MSEVVTENPLNRHLPWAALEETITPTEVFFCRNHYPFPEAPQRLQWGDRVITVDELREMPQVRRAITLECAGNGRTAFAPVPTGTPWERRGLSTGWFSGVTLATLLEAFPHQGGWEHLVFEGADDGAHGPYARSLTQAEIQQLSPFIALDMNDAPLPHQHGGPMRLIVPGYFAMTSVKWLRRFWFSDQPCQGYYQLEDYQIVPEGADKPVRAVTWMRAKSLFSHPLDGATVQGRRVQLRGKAWGGRGAVLAVDVEVNGERHSAQLTDDLGRWAWRPFQLEIDLQPGEYTAAAFCRLENEEQPREAMWNRQGYENNSAHTVRFTVTG
jgi:DMSO/TMAO reductase YedYZ molybdopterin-dependent catalytic subunit